MIDDSAMLTLDMRARNKSSTFHGARATVVNNMNNFQSMNMSTRSFGKSDHRSQNDATSVALSMKELKLNSALR